MATFFLCMLMPLAVKAEVCGGTSDQKCNASALFTEFQSVYLAAIASSNPPQGLCIRLTREDDEVLTIVFKLENGTQVYQDTEIISYTDEPDIVNITFGNNPSTPHIVQVLYADYDACFVTKFINEEFYGCRLWVSDEATGDQISACTEKHVQVCSGTIQDIWNEDACA